MNHDEALWTYHQTENVQNLEIGHPRQEMLFSVLSRLVKPGKKILEIGFGDGYLLQKLARRYMCFGADISEENLFQMSKKIPSVEFRLASVNGQLPFARESFDGFVASEVLEHMTDGELVVAVGEIGRTLKKGGLAIVTVPAEERLKDNECFCPNCGHVFHKWGHKQVWNRKKIAKTFVDFNIIKISEFFVPYHGNNLFERIVGLIMHGLRNLANIFTKIGGRSYLIIIQKR